MTLTISFGVASFPQHGTTRQELLGAADDALYAAKELGRDRTVIYSKEVVGVLTPANGRNGTRNEQLATVLALAEALDMRDAAHRATLADRRAAWRRSSRVSWACRSRPWSGCGSPGCCTTSATSRSRTCC